MIQTTKQVPVSINSEGVVQYQEITLSEKEVVENRIIELKYKIVMGTITTEEETELNKLK